MQTPLSAGNSSAWYPSTHSRRSGHGRCLINLGHPHDAAPILQHARELFTRLRAAPALAETDTLLRQTTALSS